MELLAVPDEKEARNPVGKRALKPNPVTRYLDRRGNASQGDLFRSPLVQFPLTADQAAILAPIVRAASAKRRNTLFVATAVPHWSGTWTFQVMNVSARAGGKISRIIEGELEPARP